LRPQALLRLSPPRVRSAVAVIAGACGLGRTLAEQIRSYPLLGVRVAGSSTDRSPARTGEAAA